MFPMHISEVPSELIEVYQWIIGALVIMLTSTVGALVYLYKQSIKTSETLAENIEENVKATMSLASRVDMGVQILSGKIDVLKEKENHS